MTKYYCSGAIVMSIAGRDKNEIYLIKNVDGSFAELVNGKTRPIDSPKKKNIKHLHLLKRSVDIDWDKFNNADAIVYLKDYKKSSDCK